MEMSEVFWSFLITSIIGCVLATSRLVYKSKCREMSVCCFHVVRDTEGEEKLDKEAMDIARIHGDNNNV